MDLDGAVIVITGGGSGIGAALAERFLRERPAAVVVVDLQADAVEQVANRLAGVAPEGVDVWARACDVSSEEQLSSLLDDVEQRNGLVDLFCANAGIGSAQGLDASEDTWDRVWQVNVMAHVRAARLLVPRWTERGSGHLLVTASAAGLLSNLGDAPYSVTKHGAVALAEWISITYGDQGVGVSCLCPQGVRTPLLFGAAGAEPLDELALEVVKAQRILEPDEVADVTTLALQRDEFLILPHEEVADYERARAGDRGRWLSSMRRLQARLDGR